jgi:Mg2+/citrate symporter
MMSDTDIKRIELALKKVNNVYKLLITIMIANIIVLFGVAWWASSIDARVTHLEKDEAEIIENMIDPMVWKYNDYFTRYLWAERWGQPLPEQPIRGIAPNL